MKRHIYALYEDGTAKYVKTIDVETAYEATVWMKEHDDDLRDEAYSMESPRVIGFNLTGHTPDSLKKKIAMPIWNA